MTVHKFFSIALFVLVGCALYGSKVLASPCAYVPDAKYTTGGAGCAADCQTFYDSYSCSGGGKACLIDTDTIPLDCPTGQTCCFVGEVAPTQPATSQPTAGAGTTAQAPVTSFDTSGCKVPGTNYSFPCPLGERPIAEIVGSLIRWTLGLVGALFFAMFIYGGFMYIIAGENAKNAETGQKTLVNAVIGLAIVITSYILVGWLIAVFTGSVGGEGTTNEPASSGSSGTSGQTVTCGSLGSSAGSGYTDYFCMDASAKKVGAKCNGQLNCDTGTVCCANPTP